MEEVAEIKILISSKLVQGRVAHPEEHREVDREVARQEVERPDHPQAEHPVANRPQVEHPVANRPQVEHPVADRPQAAHPAAHPEADLE